MSTVSKSSSYPSVVMLSIKSYLVMTLTVLSLALPVAGFANVVLADNISKGEAFAPQDSFGRDTPRSTIQNFVKALSDKDVDLSAKYLDSDFLKKTKNL